MRYATMVIILLATFSFSRQPVSGAESLRSALKYESAESMSWGGPGNHVAMAEDGRFVVTWGSYAIRFSADGQALDDPPISFREPNDCNIFAGVFCDGGSAVAMNREGGLSWFGTEVPQRLLPAVSAPMEFQWM